MIEFIERSTLSEPEMLEVLELWNNEYPEKLSYKSKEEFNQYLNDLTEQYHILVINNRKINGWYFNFNRDGERWFAMILDHKIQGKRIGSKILELAKQKENELNGWVIDHNQDKKKNGDSYSSPLNFYIKNGFRTTTTRLDLDKISAVKIVWKST